MAWPTSVAGNSDLFLAQNNFQTTLNGAIDAVTTTVVLTSAAALPATGGYVTIGTEAIKYTGKSGNTLTGVTRGADGTTAAAHANLAPVFGFFVAHHHNVLKDEVIALETSLDLTASRALQSSASGRVEASGVTSTELGHLSGVTSAIQTQLTAKAPLASPVFTGQVSIAAGTVLLPGLIFSGDANCGIYQSAADNIDFATNGLPVVSITGPTIRQLVVNSSTGGGSNPAIGFLGALTTGINNSGTTIQLFNSGSNNWQFASAGRFTGLYTSSTATPGINHGGDTDTGIAFPAANNIALVTGGVVGLQINSSQQILAVDGTAGAPSLSFATDTDLGFYRSAANTIDAIVGSSLIAARFINSGGTPILRLPDTVQFISDTGLSWEAGAGQMTFRVGGNGIVNIDNSGILLNSGHSRLTFADAGDFIEQGGSGGIDISDNSVVQARFELSATAGDTGMYLYDVDNATLERVTVGAADSGGTGFKVLRIPN